MNSHRVIKWFRDYADNIEAVNIHYVLTVVDGIPDWNRSRTTRYMPLVGKSVRMKELRLPLTITDERGQSSNHYVLHYYFEICQGGDRQYSPLYSEEVVTREKGRFNIDFNRSGNKVERG